MVEAIEYASKTNAEIVNHKAFEFVIQSLTEDAPRVKWKAEKVISKYSSLISKLLNKAVTNLLVNTDHAGTVVRWTAATALSKVILLNTPLNKQLIPAEEAIIVWEQDNAIKKIFQQALKKNRKTYRNYFQIVSAFTSIILPASKGFHLLPYAYTKAT